MGCNKCGSENLDVNGLFYTCKDCGDIDDSTFSMIMSRAKKSEDGVWNMVRCMGCGMITDNEDIFCSDSCAFAVTEDESLSDNAKIIGKYKLRKWGY